MEKWKETISKNKHKIPTCSQYKAEFCAGSCRPQLSVLAEDIDPLIFQSQELSLCLPFSSQNKVMCSSTLTNEIGNITGGLILSVQDPLILTKICSKWDIYTNQYTLKCMVCQGKPSRTCSLIFIKNKRLKIYLFLPNAERYGEGNVTRNFNVTALKLYSLYKTGFSKWRKWLMHFKKTTTSKQKCSWSALPYNGNGFLEWDGAAMGRIRLFNTRRAELRSVSSQQYFSFYLCICNVLTSTPRIQFVTNVRENSMHK